MFFLFVKLRFLNLIIFFYLFCHVTVNYRSICKKVPKLTFFLNNLGTQLQLYKLARNVSFSIHVLFIWFTISSSGFLKHMDMVSDHWSPSNINNHPSMTDWPKTDYPCSQNIMSKWSQQEDKSHKTLIKPSIIKHLWIRHLSMLVTWNKMLLLARPARPSN